MVINYGLPQLRYKRRKEMRSRIMKLKKEKVKKLMEEYCDVNYNRFAREMGVDLSHVHRYITKGIGGGAKLIGGVMKFYKEKHLDYTDYIEL